MTGLHLILRNGTKHHHQLVDEAFGRLDLSSVGGLVQFLRAHHMALSVTEAYFGSFSASFPAPPRMTELVESDLAQLGWSRPQNASMPHPDFASPWGVAYVVAGASMGRKVLQKSWQSSTDIRVRSAGSFLTDISMAEYWRTFRDALEDQDISPSVCELAVESGRNCFSLFLNCLNSLCVTDTSNE